MLAQLPKRATITLPSASALANLAREFLQDVRVGQTMEAVAHQTFIPIVPRERIELGDLSSPWWNHDFLSDETCIGDSGDFDDGRVVTMKRKNLVDAQPLQSDQSAQKAQ